VKPLDSHTLVLLFSPFKRERERDREGEGEGEGERNINKKYTCIIIQVLIM
jgi:hypothetical protein